MNVEETLTRRELATQDAERELAQTIASSPGFRARDADLTLSFELDEKVRHQNCLISAVNIRIYRGIGDDGKGYTSYNATVFATQLTTKGIPDKRLRPEWQYIGKSFVTALRGLVPALALVQFPDIYNDYPTE